MYWYIKKILRFILTRTSKIWPSKLYLKLLFILSGGDYALDLDNPQTFNEHLNWNKLYDHNPLYHRLVDKYEVKGIVEDLIGKEYIVPCYGVWDNLNDIDYSSLPNKFVLKSTHDSSGAFVCQNKDHLDLLAVRNHFKDFEMGNYWPAREWAYKGVKPRILADQLLDDDSGHELTDYKFWCFNGEPKVMYITNKGEHVEENFYDMEFKPLMIDHGFPRSIPEYEKPNDFEKMKELARILSKDMSFVRVDFFDIKGKIYFGEFTFYDWGGYMPFANYEMDKHLGNLWD